MSNSSTSAHLSCLCGCKQDTTSKVNYRPGHDAKHVSILRDVILQSAAGYNGRNADKTAKTVAAAFQSLPSDALRLKLATAIENYDRGGLANSLGDMGVAVPFGENPALAKVRNAEEADRVQGTDEGIDYGQQYEDGAGNSPEVIRVVETPDVKVGRWFYPGRELHTESGVVLQRNEKRDGSGEWVLA